MTAGSWPAIETVREALDGALYPAREDGTRVHVPRYENAQDALARLEAICEAAENAVDYPGNNTRASLREALAAAEEISTCQNCGAYWNPMLYKRCPTCGGHLQ